MIYHRRPSLIRTTWQNNVMYYDMMARCRKNYLTKCTAKPDGTCFAGLRAKLISLTPLKFTIMTIVKARPYRSRLDPFSDLMRTFFDTPTTSNGWFTQPAVNITEEDKHFLVELAAPGMEKKDFQIDLDHNMLKISAEKTFTETAGSRNIQREYFYGTFSKTFTLPEGVDAEKIAASYDAGVLRITLPKSEDVVKKMRQIKVG